MRRLVLLLAGLAAAGCGTAPPDGPWSKPEIEDAAIAGGSGGAAGGGRGGSAGAPKPDAREPTVADVRPPEADTAVEAAAPDAASEAGATTSLVKIFDGTSFDDWVYDPKAWRLVDGAMVGKTAGGQSQAFTKSDYSNFRLLVSSRMKGNDHLGICLWGSRPAAGSYGFGKCLLVIPPNAAIWDYLTNTDNPKPDYQKGQAEWHRTEILANRQTGRVLVAVNGKLLHDYRDPPAKLPRRQHGPIGMQIHKAGFEVEYKDIEIEIDPKSDKLLTVAP